jgi:serine/threonine protein kinase
VRVVGRGGQATVELWYQRATGEIFAAKVFLRPPAKLADRVADEARMLITLSHPSLLRGFVLFLPDAPGESAVILTQNCSGGSLAELIENGSLTATEKNKAIVSLAKGLVFLHSQHILHRDLKPSNVMFDEVRNALIGDFGSARVIEQGISQSQAAQTAFYAAPELHDDSDPSEASDVWAWGLTVFEMLAGEPAFDPQLRLRPLLNRMASNERPPIPKEASPVLKEVLEQCWDQDPTKRPTAAEICVKFADAEWLLVEGAVAKEVEAHVASFPLDATATKEELVTAVAQKEREKAKQKAEIDSLRSELALLTAGRPL